MKRQSPKPARLKIAHILPIKSNKDQCHRLLDADSVKRASEDHRLGKLDESKEMYRCECGKMIAAMWSATNNRFEPVQRPHPYCKEPRKRASDKYTGRKRLYRT